MSKDQAARIAEKIRDAISSFYPTIESGDKAVARHKARIRRAITTAVRKERERCVKCVNDAASRKIIATSGLAAMRVMEQVAIEAINGGKRGKA